MNKFSFYQYIAVLCTVGFLLTGCKDPEHPHHQSGDTVKTIIEPHAPVYGYEVIASYPHDPSAFTQGLQYVDGFFYEGTGLYGKSSLRKVELKTGKVIKKYVYHSEIFAEGITLLGDKIYQISYLNQKGFVFDAKTFMLIDSFRYVGEGWGMTTDGSSLIVSNGSNTIQWLDPVSKKVIKTLDVFDAGNPLYQINELELIAGDLYANVWQTDRIVIIDTTSGKVKASLNLANIIPPSERRDTDDVLNGIAYDEKDKRIFVTGKNWYKLFEIKILTAASN